MWRIIRSNLTRGRLIILGITVVIVGLLLCKMFFVQPQLISNELTEEIVSTEEQMETVSSELKSYADIKGAVQHPGVYRLTSNMRLLDLIQLAGGLSKEADDRQINQALIVQDQTVFYIPKIGEDVSELEEVQGEVAKSSSGEQDTKININSATEVELEQLDGVGAKKAAAIVSYREEHGSFKTIENLSDVSGIGSKTVERLKDKLTI
ncbi:comEA protein [Vagococcus coleopterorum]|uniref:ComEA protein n=1 Tax=Vagococcus coleopterorum TaxID=2714946 RepID=A0A6G8AMS9_9ENTE|nr:helix-hairpin-helix domain-containing protein [Vagococcus coleopterorum]QIL46307.1 comEA protein [Vagococcus coleopterorum]